MKPDDSRYHGGDLNNDVALEQRGRLAGGRGREARRKLASEVSLASWRLAPRAMLRLAQVPLYLGIVCIASCSFSISDFGAVPSDVSDAAAATNAAALQKAFLAANASRGSDRTVLVPAGDFTILNATMTGLVDVTFQIEGTLLLSANRSAWPPVWNDGGDWGALQFEQATGLTIVGTGPKVHVNGQGYDWWWCVTRPHNGRAVYIVF